MSDFFVLEGVEIPVVPGTRMDEARHGDFSRAFSGAARSDTRGHFRTAQVQTSDLTTAQATALRAILQSPGTIAVSGPLVGTPSKFHVGAGWQVSPITADWWRASFELVESEHAPSPVLVMVHADATGPVTFSRASVAYEVDQYGILRSAASGVLRTSWRVNPVSGKLEPFAPLELARTNVLHGSNLVNGTTDDWTGASVFTVTEVSSYFPSQSAWQHEGDGNRFQTRGTLGAVPETQSVILENVDATTSALGIYDATAAAFVARVSYTWATDSFGSIDGTEGTAQSATVETLQAVGPNGGKLVRLTLTTTPSNDGNTRRIYVYPTGTTTNTDTAIIHHVQHEEAPLASSPVVTPTGAPATRAVEILSHAAPPAGMTLVGYHSFVERGTREITEARTWQIGDGSSFANPIFGVRVASGAYRIGLGVGNGTASVAATTTTLPAIGDFVEHIPVLEYELDEDGRPTGRARIRLVQAINGSLSGSSAFSSYINATALIESGWQTSDTLYVNSRDAGSNAGAQELHRIGFFEGWAIQSALSGDDAALLTECRALSAGRKHRRTVFG